MHTAPPELHTNPQVEKPMQDLRGLGFRVQSQGLGVLKDLWCRVSLGLGMFCKGDFACRSTSTYKSLCQVELEK